MGAEALDFSGDYFLERFSREWWHHRCAICGMHIFLSESRWCCDTCEAIHLRLEISRLEPGPKDYPKSIDDLRQMFTLAKVRSIRREMADSI